MEFRRFDMTIRSFAASRSRRAALGILAAMATAGIDLARADAAAHRRRRHQARWTPQPPTACDAAAISGIAGQVLIGPMCPVERIDQPCPDQPFVAEIVIHDASGHIACATRSGADGDFRVGLPPGSYVLVPIDPNPGAPPHGTPLQVTVRASEYVDVTVRFDSGIR